MATNNKVAIITPPTTSAPSLTKFAVPHDSDSSSSEEEVSFTAISLSSRSKSKDSIIGASGWQILAGKPKGMDYYPIVILNPGTIIGLTMITGETKLLPTTVLVCKNIRRGEIPTEAHPGVIARIGVIKPLPAYSVITLCPGEKDKMEWIGTIPTVVRNDRISVYCPDLTGITMELFSNYSSNIFY